jgi:hypothetical protein
MQSSQSRPDVAFHYRCQLDNSAGAKVIVRDVESTDEDLAWKDGALVLRVAGKEWAWKTSTYILAGAHIIVPPLLTVNDSIRITRQGVVPIRASRDWIDVKREISCLWEGKFFIEGPLHPRPFGNELRSIVFKKAVAANKRLYSIGSEAESVAAGFQSKLEAIHFGTVSSLEDLSHPHALTVPEPEVLEWTVDSDASFLELATPRGESERMARMAKSISRFMTFIDPFAGYGWDSMSLSHLGNGVAIERDPDRVEMAKENLRQRDVKVIHGDAYTYNGSADLVYLDPPYGVLSFPTGIRSSWLVVKRRLDQSVPVSKEWKYILSVSGTVRFDYFVSTKFDVAAFEKGRIERYRDILQTQAVQVRIGIGYGPNDAWRFVTPLSQMPFWVIDPDRPPPQSVPRVRSMLYPGLAYHWPRIMLELAVRPVPAIYEWTGRDFPIALFSLSNSINGKNSELLSRIATSGVVCVPFGHGMRREFDRFEDHEYHPTDFPISLGFYTALDYIVANRHLLQVGMSVGAHDVRARTWMVVERKKKKELWQFVDVSQTHLVKIASNLLRHVKKLDPLSLYEIRSSIVRRFGGFPLSDKVSGYLPTNTSPEYMKRRLNELRTVMFMSKTEEYVTVAKEHKDRWFPIAKSKASQLLRMVDVTGARSALFLAEAPGMFAKVMTSELSITDWAAVSLDDAEDPFGFIAETREHWTFSDVSSYHADRKFDLVVADLGFEPVSPSRQEDEHLETHVAVIRKALEHVALGGTIICKLYGATFQQFDLKSFSSSEAFFSKPEASNVFNSEVYMFLHGVQSNAWTPGSGYKTKFEPSLRAIWDKTLRVTTNLLGIDSWVDEKYRFYVDVSGHMSNFLLASDYVLFDFSRYMDNIEGNVRQRGKPPRAIDESGSGGLWHSAVEWYLGTFAAEETARRFHLALNPNVLSYVRRRLISLSKRYPRFNQRSKTTAQNFPRSADTFKLSSIV